MAGIKVNRHKIFKIGTNKLKYNGMTVGRIGTISEFLRADKTYIKGKIIRIEDLHEDFNYLNEIGQEMDKGVFI